MPLIEFFALILTFHANLFIFDLAENTGLLMGTVSGSVILMTVN